MDFFVCPCGEEGPSYEPTQGGTNVFVDVEDKKQCAKRDFTAELRAVQNAVSAVPAPQELIGEIKSNGSKRNGSVVAATLADLTFPTPIQTLELLRELRPVA